MDETLKELRQFVGHTKAVRIKVKNFQTHRFQITSCKFSPDGRYMFSSSNDKTVKLWDCETGQCIHTITTHISIVR